MNENEFKDYFYKGIKKIKLEIPEEKIDYKKFYKYLLLLNEYNHKFNLTGIKTSKRIIEKHFIESILLYPYIRQINSNSLKEKQILDIGSGAGFPGMPLKIIEPQFFLTLIEAVQKKVYFLKKVKLYLGLNNVEIFPDRAEKFSHYQNNREKFDIVLSRAVGKLSILIELCLPFLKNNGIAIFLKGKKLRSEIEEAHSGLKILYGKILKIDNYILPYSNESGKIIIIRKCQKIPLKFPRNKNKLGKF